MDIPPIEKTAAGFPARVPCWAPSTDPNVLAFLWCGNGHGAALVKDRHAIAADGTVTPSCVCPVDGCGWHEHERLLEWQK